MSKGVWVIGGGTGIGAEVVRLLSDDGFDVTFTYNTSLESATALQREVASLVDRAPTLAHCPLDDLDRTEQVIRQLLVERGVPFGIVHVAGTAHDQLAATISLARAERLLRVNFLSMVCIVKLALRPMLAQRAGRIVGISSVAAAMGGRGNGIYSATKAALEAYLRCLTDETRNKGVTVNWIRPGIVDTAMMPSTAAREDVVRSRVPLARVAHPREIAEGVRFLMSDGASYVHGCGLTIDGGLTAVLGNHSASDATSRQGR